MVAPNPASRGPRSELAGEDPGLVIVSLSLPPRIIDAMDELIRRRGHRGRSELVRAALRDFANADRLEQELRGDVALIVVLQYAEDGEPELSDIRHAHNDLVKSMLHAHTNGDMCTTVLQCAGPAHPMRRLLTELRGMKELDSISITLAHAPPRARAPRDTPATPLPTRASTGKDVRRRPQNS